MKWIFICSAVCLAACGGRIDVPAPKDTITLECNVDGTNLVCDLPEDVVNGGTLSLRGPQGEPGPQGHSGTQGVPGQNGEPGSQGVSGTNGVNGIECTALTIQPIAVYGVCVYLGHDIWVKNKGNEMSVYSNEQCDHHLTPYNPICDDLKPNHMCWVETNQITIQGTGEGMVIYFLQVNPGCVTVLQ